MQIKIPQLVFANRSSQCERTIAEQSKRVVVIHCSQGTVTMEFLTLSFNLTMRKNHKIKNLYNFVCMYAFNVLYNATFEFRE